MPLSILNNVAALIAENSLSQAQAGQQKVLQQLSTGLKINTSADDAAGLFIATGMQANVAAITQSQSNANNGIGFLQVADGALSQVTSLLNRAVTLATEASSSGLTSQQRTATDTEYQSILTEINQIGTTTEFNGTQVFTDGNNSSISLANGGTSITGTVNPADTLSGGFDVTSTIPGAGGTTTGIAVADSGGTSASATITPGAALSGSLTVTSSGPGGAASSDPITFTTNSDGSTITSSQITTGATLSGDLVINSSGGNASDSDTINLADYQGLASSDSATATAAANQLAADMTTAMKETTGSTYTASISGGVLTIQTSNPVVAPAGTAITNSNSEMGTLYITGLDLGATLSGTLTLSTSGGNSPGSCTIDFGASDLQGLTSNDPTTQAQALANLGNDLDAALGSSTGATYTTLYDAYGRFHITPSDGETLTVSDSSLTQTPALGTQNLPLNGSGWIQTNSTAPGTVLSGYLNVSSTGNVSATASINLADGYSDILGSNQNALNEQASLQQALNTDVSATGTTYHVSAENGALFITTFSGSNFIIDNGSTIQATLNSPGEALSVGGASNGLQTTSGPAPITFTASNYGATITSSQIIAGETLSGNLVIDTSGGNASDSGTISLANYQDLASSDSTKATAAANQLAIDLTTAMKSTTGSTYTASISGGVLTIQTSNPVAAPTGSAVTTSNGGMGELYLTGLDLGTTLSGSLTLSSTGGNSPGSCTIDFGASDLQGLTSNDPSTQAQALVALQNKLDDAMRSTTGATYSAFFDVIGRLHLVPSDGETLTASNSSLTQTPVFGTQSLPLGDANWIQTISTAPGTVLSGYLNVSSIGLDGSGTASINLADGYSDLLGSDQNALNEQANLQAALNTDLSAAGSACDVAVNNGALYIMSIYGGGTISDNGSTIEATLSSPGETLSVDNSSDGAQSSGSSSSSAQTTISLASQTTAGLQSYLQGLLSDYTVSYNNTSGLLSILLNNGNADGYTSFSTSGSPQQTVGGSSPVTSTAAVSLAGVTSSTLASSLLTQLGGNYTVSYDQTTGALSIGISTAGSGAGITSIASSNNSATETAPGGGDGASSMNVFTSDGTTNGGTSLDVTVGSLTTANLGASDGNAGEDMTGTSLLTQTDAATTLALITAAISDISSQRGAVGANENRLTAIASDESTAQINLTSAADSIEDADIGKTVASMTQYDVLQATGMAALQQTNQAQQAVLRLLQ